jgi:hypothetical protein
VRQKCVTQESWQLLTSFHLFQWHKLSWKALWMLKHRFDRAENFDLKVFFPPLFTRFSVGTIFKFAKEENLIISIIKIYFPFLLRINFFLIVFVSRTRYFFLKIFYLAKIKKNPQRNEKEVNLNLISLMEKLYTIERIKYELN